jgi:tetratricopeptide repeat protein 8
MCTIILTNQPRNQAAILLKYWALALKSWGDDSNIEEEGLGEMLLEDNATSSMPRFGI